MEDSLSSILLRINRGQWHREPPTSAPPKPTRQARRARQREEGPELAAHEHQQHLYLKAVQGNSVAVLPTGGGKTFVAVMLARYQLSNARPDQQVWVVCPTQALAEQQSRYFARHAGVPVRTIHGGAGIDEWTREQWHAETHSARVLVFTYASLLQGLSHAMIDQETSCLLVVDECHHATSGDSPLAQLMERMCACEHMRILGLTASPVVTLSGNVSIPQALANLESAMGSKLCSFPLPAGRHNLTETVHLLEVPKDDLDRLRDRLMADNDAYSKLDSRFFTAAAEIAFAIGSRAAKNYLRTERPTAVMPTEWPWGEQSSKYQALVSLLNERRTLQTIVFVQRRAVALELVQELNACGFVCAAVLGAKSREASETAREARNVQLTLERFENGELSLLVATSVLEEGIDVAACALVVAYDGFANEKSYIQTKGRCRAHEREFVAWIGTGANEQKRLNRARDLEDNVIQYIEERYHFSESLDDDNGDIDDAMAYSVERTGACIDLRACVSLVNRFAQTLRGNLIYSEIPAGDKMFVSELLLPCELPTHLRRFVSPPRATKSSARRAAAMSAIIALHGASWLNDHLLPVEIADVVLPLIVEKPQPHQQEKDEACVSEAALEVSIYHYHICVDVGTVPVHLVLSIPRRVDDEPRCHEFYFSRIGLDLTATVLGRVEEAPADEYSLLHLFNDATSPEFGIALLPSHPVTESQQLWVVDGRPDRVYFVLPDSESLSLASLHHGKPLAILMARHWNCVLPDGELPITRAVSLSRKVVANLHFPPSGQGIGEPSAKYLRFMSPALGHSPVTQNQFIRVALEAIPSLIRVVCLATAAATISRSLALSPCPWMEEALACPSACFPNGLSYQRLETVGDAVLKLLTVESLFRAYDYDEGRLSSAKDLIVSNVALARVYRNGPLAHMMSAANLTEGLPQWGCFDPSTNMPEKRCADLVESVLGAVWCSTLSLEKCKHSAQWLGIQLPEQLQEESHELGEQPPVAQYTGFFEAVLERKYHDPSLLREALSHPSALNLPCRSYNRLEFLGDAVLDLACVLYARECQPDASPGELSNWRYALVSTECLGLICLHHGWQKHVDFFSQTLMGSIDAATRQPFREVDKLWFFEFPKVLADVTESVVGSVFVDSQFDLSVALATVLKICEPVWSQLRAAGKPPLNPVRLVHERFANVAPVTWSDETLFVGNFPLVQGQTTMRLAAQVALELCDAQPEILGALVTAMQKGS